MQAAWKPIGTYRTIPLPPRPIPPLHPPPKFRPQVKKLVVVPVVPLAEAPVVLLEPEPSVVGLNNPL